MVSIKEKRIPETALKEPKDMRDSLFNISSRIIGREKAKFLFKVYDLARFDIFGKPKGAIGSIDVTNRCNLRCRHCYFYAHDYESEPELTDDEWIEKFEGLKKEGFPFYQCSWIGGEPLLRKSLIERGMGYFRSNMVTTNGTIELPCWPDVNFYVSLDGPRDMHDSMRGAGTYDRITKNINRPDLKILLSMVITAENHTGVEAFVDEWRERGGVKGVLFQFYTPVKGLENDDLWPHWELRDKIIDDLIRLKDKHGDFIFLPNEAFEMMRSDRCQDITRDCLFRQVSFCFDPQGREKKPCMMGPMADCSRCGCVLPFHLKCLEDKRLVLREMLMSLRRAFGRQALR
ncbi:MAG: radical SAM protein [Candidatus Brocadiales bacterium]|nr:radical SAM protein [Candidatus Bathyanammoxibius amoris]